jgi:hypothetical protein
MPLIDLAMGIVPAYLPRQKGVSADLQSQGKIDCDSESLYLDFSMTFSVYTQYEKGQRKL